MENLKFKRQQKLKVILEFRSLILVCSPPHCCLQNCFHQRLKCIKVFKCKSYQCITLNAGNVQFNFIFFLSSWKLYTDSAVKTFSVKSKKSASHSPDGVFYLNFPKIENYPTLLFFSNDL